MKTDIDISLGLAVKAFNAMQRVTPLPTGGRGRVFVEFKMEERLSGTVCTNLKRAGFRLSERRGHRGTGRLYIGFDNATGRELAMGQAVAKIFKDAGFPCACETDPG
jgi:hypothetical protein